MIQEQEITLLLQKISSGIAVDPHHLTDTFNRFLQVQQPHLIAFMNNQFFKDDYNLIFFIKDSIDENSKEGEQKRKIVYEFITDYIETFKDNLHEYLKGLFENFFGFFRLQKPFRCKQKSLGPVRQILLSYEAEDLIKSVLKPEDFHKTLVTILKVEKVLPSVRGQIWYILGILQNKFASEIPFVKKKEVQSISFTELKTYVNSDKNVSTIALILRSFIHSLNENYLEENALEELFSYCKAIIIPVKATFDASIAATQLLIAQASLFHTFIIKNASGLFKQLTGLMGHQNKNFKFAVLDALCAVIKQIVIGINSNLEDENMVKMFHFLGNEVWGMLEKQTTYDPNATAEEKNRFAGSVISIVKILGIMSPLILAINGKDDLKKFFSKLLSICGRKVLKAFQEIDGSYVQNKKILMMKVVLYHQKQLISFISSFAKILEQLDDIDESDTSKLEDLFMVSIRQYPFYLQKYRGNLIEAMVVFLMGLSTKPHIFSKQTKKLILKGLMQSLDAKKHNINRDRDYYSMIAKSATLWKQLLTHPKWHNIVVQQFSRIFFDAIEYLFLNLDVSYKTNLEMEIEEDKKEDKQDNLDLANVFFLSDETIMMCNVADYQYISGLSLIFNEILSSIEPTLYSGRLFGFYEQIIYRIKIFPKSIPLMKIVRSLNAFITRTQWFEHERDDTRNEKELLISLSNFYKFTNDNLFRFQQNYFYETLKMLLSMPYQIYLMDDCYLLKNSLPIIIKKSLQLGQQIISLAQQTIYCIEQLFGKIKLIAVKYLAECIPELQKYMNFTKQSDTGIEQTEFSSQEKEEVRSYLFLKELKIRKDKISENVIKFLGTVGGIAHEMVENKTKEYISWDYHCKLEIRVGMENGGFFKINLTKLLSRTCQLMNGGTEVQKIVASQFMHAIIVYAIGRIATKVPNEAAQTKQNISNFFDKILPTILSVASNTSHPSQQLIHTLLIQTIHFFANTQDPNSPDIQTLLRHLLALYTGAEDSSFLASKCLSELVKWHIKQAPAIDHYTFPIVKTVVRNVWSLVSNKKARNGLIQFLIKFLKVIHRQQKLMSMYSIEFCSMIISLSRTDGPIETSLDYLIKKYILAINSYIKYLIIEEGGRKYRRISTLQKLVEWIYNNTLFSIHRQQRNVSFMIWESILSKYGSSFSTKMRKDETINNVQIFLSEHCDREQRYLFSQNKAVIISEEQPKLDKVLPKITAFGEMWIKINEKNIFDPKKLTTFRDFKDIYIRSFTNFLQYFIYVFIPQESSQRIIDQATQKHMANCLLVFAEVGLSIKPVLQSVIQELPQQLSVYHKKSGRGISLCDIYFKLLFQPNSLIPNFNFDIIQEYSDYTNLKQFTKPTTTHAYNQIIINFLWEILQNTFLPELFSYLNREFKLRGIGQIIRFVFKDSKLYDRQIKCVLLSLSLVARKFSNCKQFDPLIKSTLQLTVQQHEQKSGFIQQPHSEQLSSEKKRLLIWFTFQFSEHYSLVQNFLVKLIEHDTAIFNKYEKNVMKAIAQNWFSINKMVVGLIHHNKGFLKNIIVLCKMLQKQKLENLYELLQYYLPTSDLFKKEDSIDLNLHKQKVSKQYLIALGESLKINFYLLQFYQSITQCHDYLPFLQNLVFESMKIPFTSDYHEQIHEQALNLAALMLSKMDQSSQQMAKDFSKQFISKFRVLLKSLIIGYIPDKISKLSQQKNRQKCFKFLKIFKSVMILSKNIHLIEFLFSILKDAEIPEFYLNFLKEIIDESLQVCIRNQAKLKQIQNLTYLLSIFWDDELDNDCWRNIRVIVTEMIIKPALKISSIETLIQVFNTETQNLLRILRMGLAGTVQEIIKTMEMKRAAFMIIEQLYSNLPRKEKQTERIHTKQYHKQIIKACIQILKTKFNEKTQETLNQYDRKYHKDLNKELIVTKTQKLENKKPSCAQYLRNYCCSAYNCLIVVFISTQSNKNHFASYIFDPKGHLWNNIIDPTKIEYDFQIQTNFQVMKEILPINKTLKNSIKNKYWSNSLYVIEEEFVPTSLIQSLPQIPEENQNQNGQNTEISSPNVLELDVVNKHPCMINLLRVVDHLHAAFFDGTQPVWMKPLYQQLNSDMCPLSTRILLTKLILNRPNIFSQEIWGEVLLKYLVLKQNGSKFIHYFYRDTLRQFLTFVNNGYKIQDPKDICSIIMKIIKALPHQNKMIYADNVDILESLLKMEGVFTQKNLLIKMLLSSEKNKSEKQDSKDNSQVRLKFQWRMCALIALKSCLVYKTPVLDSYQQLIKTKNNNHLKFKFFFEIRNMKIIELALEMINENVKKYRITASGFLGELLQFFFDFNSEKSQYESLLQDVTRCLKKIAQSEANRTSKQKFSTCVVNVTMKHPQILESVNLFNTVESCLTQYQKEERDQILQTLIYYIDYLIKNDQVSNVVYLLVTIRKYAPRFLTDIREVQNSLLTLLLLCTTHTKILLRKQIIETYYFIFDDLQATYSRTNSEETAEKYYQMLIKIKDFINDPDTPKTDEIRKLGQLVKKALIKALGSKFYKIREFVFSEFERQKNYQMDTANRIIDIFLNLYDQEYQQLWLVNVVPLIYSDMKKSSDYTRLRFEENLGELTAFYDWDFRRNMKLFNSSQPYTPAFTLATGANNYRRADGTIQQSALSSLGGDKLRGMLRASQYSYMSQEQQIFTILASQSDSNPAPSSFGSSFNSSVPGFGSSQGQNTGEAQEQGQNNEVIKKIKQMFGQSRRRRNKIMEQFKESQFKNISPSVKLVNNKLRFNKNVEKSQRESYKDKNTDKNEQKNFMIRKYKIGELPDIQITTQDIIDPMLFLANHDHDFAAELLILIFMRAMEGINSEKKEKFKEVICELLEKSKKHQYNFISSLQKTLICLCQNGYERIDYSMKEVAYKSNTFDYAIVFTEENQIQIEKKLTIMDRGQKWGNKYYENWSDLIDLYQQLNEDDLIYGVILKLAKGDQKKLLIEALQLKKLGKISEGQKTLNRALAQSQNTRIQQFINREKVDCLALLGQWDPVFMSMNQKMTKNNNLLVDEQKIFSITLQNSKIDNKEDLYKKINFHPSKCEYQKAILALLCSNDIDKAKYHSTNALKNFSSEWKKVSSFAFSSKHTLLEQIQKVHELHEFINIYQKYQIKAEDYLEVFLKWSEREANTIYDSNMTWIQLLESRIMFGNLLKNKFNIDKVELAKSTMNWLIQVSNGMIQKGALGGAEPLVRRALACRKEYPKFVWQFYESIGKLKLKQNNSELKMPDYDVVPRLVQKQMQKDSNIRQIEKLKFLSLHNDFIEGNLQKCLQLYDTQIQQDFVSKVQTIYCNYEQIKKNLKSKNLPDSKPEQVLTFKRQIYFKFTVFLEKMLSFVKGRFEISEIKEAMMSKNYDPERLSHVFVETLFTAIEISDFSSSSNIPKKSQKMVFALIMKLIKVIQMFPNQVGQYFVDAITNKKIPIWIFLYFIPQIIKFLNNPQLAPYFQDLFRNIIFHYPEAIVYTFNCYYEKQKQCQTEICKEIRRQLMKKMEINFKFIDSLILLQYPELRLKEALMQFTIAGQKQNGIDSLKKLIHVEESTLGKYNLKFVHDWKGKITKLLNKLENGDLSAKKDLEIMMQHIDINRKENLKTVVASMKAFVKVSDGSTFFEEYNSNDWNRIQVPGTSYRSFEEPKPWQRTYIDSFDYSLLTLQSKQRPRRITVFGSDQKKYMLLVKAGEDVRLDQRIQQIFDIMNKILKDQSQCSKKQVMIPRFEVIPIKKMMGIFEWIDESQTLRDFLEVELKEVYPEANLKDANGAIKMRMNFINKVAPYDSSNPDQNQQHKALLKLPDKDIQINFQDCMNQIPYGLLRKALKRLSKNYDSYLHIKNAFLSNYAVICVVTYILGIGDRHLENFLIHMATASIVPIDFGFSFGASIDLGVPELMPFRLTKCFSQLAEPIGFEGIFKKSMIASYDALADNMQLIADYCDVFVDDPLLEWVWNHRKYNQGKKNPSYSRSEQPIERAFFNKKIQSVRRKLARENPRIILQNLLAESPHKHRDYMQKLKQIIWRKCQNKEKRLCTIDVIDELIKLACDKNILGRTYIGWSPFI